MKSKRVWFLSSSFILLLACSAFAQSWTPPPLPDVPPLISETYSNDADGSRIDDNLELNISSHKSTRLFSVLESEEQQKLPLDVELVFNAPITQHQIDEFLRLGGEITYIYRALSYGWNGRIPLDRIDLLPSVLGSSLVLVTEPKAYEPYMNIATKTGRVRPIWKPGFAGSLYGFDGDEDMTIGIIDSGIDVNHPDFEAEYVVDLNDITTNSLHLPDLQGRCLYWGDIHEKNESPVDVHHHGSSVAGVVWGTGLCQEMDARCNNGLFWTAYSEPNAWTCGGSRVSLPGGEIEAALRSKVRFDDEANSIFGRGQRHSPGVSLRWLIHDVPSGTSIGPTPLMSGDGDCGVWIEGAQNAVITNSLSPYPASNDDFNGLRGVAPGCRLACVKVSKSGDPNFINTNKALQKLVERNKALNLRVMNLSYGQGRGGKDETERQEVNNAVGRNGIVVVVAAGNDGTVPQKDTESELGTIGDPGRAALALTVGASNDKNQLTDYSSWGFSNPDLTGVLEDYKPDLIAPGGSSYYSGIMSVDSGSSDGFFEDQQQWDYRSVQGTSLSAPFVAGCAALVIDAMEQADPNLEWDFTSSRHALFVKMILCATATETGENRENDRFNPTLQRAENGPNGFPPGKDPNEGYGIVNPDAAIEAVYMTYEWDAIDSNSLGSGPTDKRAWARRVSLSPGRTYSLTLYNPLDGDFDLYLYSGEPSSTGTPQILASSTNPDVDVDELLSYTATEADSRAILVVKRISGFGEFRLNDPSYNGAQVTFDNADAESNPDLQTLSCIPREFEDIGNILVPGYEETWLSVEKDGEDVTYTFSGTLDFLDIDADGSGPDANNQYDIYWDTYEEPGDEANTLKKYVDNRGPRGSEPDGVADQLHLIFTKGHRFIDELAALGCGDGKLWWVDDDYNGGTPDYDLTYWSTTEMVFGFETPVTSIYKGTVGPQRIADRNYYPWKKHYGAPLGSAGVVGTDDTLDRITYTYPVMGQPDVVAVYYYENSEANRNKSRAELLVEPKLASTWTTYASADHSENNVIKRVITDYTIGTAGTTVVEIYEVIGADETRVSRLVSQEVYSEAITTRDRLNSLRGNDNALVSVYRVLERTDTTITEMWIDPAGEPSKTRIVVSSIESGEELTRNEYWKYPSGVEAAEMTLDLIIDEIGWAWEVCGNPDWCDL